MYRISKIFLFLLIAVGCALPTLAQKPKPGLQEQKPREQRTTREQQLLLNAVRHELIMLPYYNVFDWLQFELKDDFTVVLRGQVVRPTLKTDSERVVSKIEGVEKVINEIEVLPLSPNDDRIRAAVYRTLFNFNSPLFRYAQQAVPPIHIIVKNGRVTLKGIVATKGDSNIANIRTRGVGGVFEVTNELEVEQREK